MFESFTNEAIAILSVTVGGVSIGSLLGLVIYVIKAMRANRAEIKLRKEDVENAFKEAILPRNIKLDVSGKIIKPINEGLDKMDKMLDKRVVNLEHGLKLTLSVLSQFTHVQKLPQDTQDQIAEYLDIPAEEISL